MKRLFRGDQPAEQEQKRTLLGLLQRQGIHDERVLAAMERVPRSLFVPPELVDVAWSNTALAIGHHQTISQPFVVALMTQALELDGNERVLEIGTGSGYQAAILAELAREVITIERIPELAADAVNRIESLGIHNVRSIVGDGSAGWSASAPYDAIIVTAGAREVPPALIAQLSEDGGRLVIPVGPRDNEHLRRLRKQGSESTWTDLGEVRFVPLIVDEEGNRKA